MLKLLSLSILMSFMIPGIVLGRLQMRLSLRSYQSLLFAFFGFYLIMGIFVTVFFEQLDPRR